MPQKKLFAKILYPDMLKPFPCYMKVGPDHITDVDDKKRKALVAELLKPNPKYGIPGRPAISLAFVHSYEDDPSLGEMPINSAGTVYFKATTYNQEQMAESDLDYYKHMKKNAISICAWSTVSSQYFPLHPNDRVLDLNRKVVHGQAL